MNWLAEHASEIKAAWGILTLFLVAAVVIFKIMED